MAEILKLIQDRQSTRGLFDLKRPVSEQDLMQILEAGRWAPTAHNMQNFEIILVDDKNVLKGIAEVKVPLSETFIRENYQQLSFSEEELLQKKVGVLAVNYPAAIRKPGGKLDAAASEQRHQSRSRLIQSSSALLIVLYDSSKRAPASEGDFLGIMSLGCVMENMWLMAYSLGIGFHVLSGFSDPTIEKQVAKLLNIPKNWHIAISVRLGYPTSPETHLRVRREINDFTHHNNFDSKGMD